MQEETVERSVEVRQARVEDVPDVVELVGLLYNELNVDLSTETITTYINSIAYTPKYMLAVAEDNWGRVVGVGQADLLSGHPALRLHQGVNVGYIDQMFVLETCRSQQIGSKLLEFLESWLKGRGAKAIFLHAALKALPFYEAQGYVNNRELVKFLP